MIRRRAALLLLPALGLAACGTWDPTADPDPEADRSTVVEQADDGATAEMTVGDGTFNFSISDCFADQDGVRFTGRSPDGDTITGEFDPEAPDDATVVVANQEGEELYTADQSSGAAAPEFQVTENGFSATGTFVSDADEQMEGSVSGAC